MAMKDYSDVRTRANLAFSYRQAGRVAEAITLQERVLADSGRLLGDQHPDTLTAAQALHAWRHMGKP